MRNTGNGNGLSVDSGNEATAQLSAGICEGGTAAVKIYGGTTLADLLAGGCAVIRPFRSSRAAKS